MSLDLGAVVGRVVLEDVQFQRTYVRVVRQMGELSAEAGKAGAGTDVLDRGLARVGAAGTTAATGLGRATKATGENAAANQRDAAAAARLAAATVRVSEAMTATAGVSKRRQVLTLQQVAADERLVASSSAVGSSEARQAAATAKLAAAQASAIGAGERLSASQTAWAAKASAAGATMTKKLTLPVVAAGAVAIDQAMKFDQATNVYVTAAGESQKNLAIIRDGIKSTAVETGTSIKNLTDAEYLVEKAGLRGADGLQVLNAAAKGAREENAQLSDVVQAMTSVMASYHLPASKAVQVMNALKTGAGQAKVTMEEYAGSLSTVIPIASANHIALQQVLGALSTLTQHGTTAKEATQELAATIRSLAAPNRVAMNEMNQLGLSVNDVTKNIGKRGLTGTIDLLVGAVLHKMGPAGLVIQNSMNQSKSALADVNVMLQRMPPNVKRLADQYVAGKISLGDWRTEIKKLPADQAALAKQFQTLTDKAHGFSQLLRSGDPAAQTFVSSLKKLSGGAIGLNTILQLSGDNMAGFKDRTDEVGKSLNDNAKQVEGWESTSKLAATRTAQFKEQMHVLAINAGAELLPMFSHLVSGLSGAVTWFGNLSHTDKAVIGWSVVILAALGPILSIGGRLSRAATGLATFAGASEATASRVALSTQRIAGALAGIGLLYGSTQTGGIAGHIMGALGGGLTGAAVGSFFGPLGTAIGGVAGALGGLGLSYLHTGDKAKAGVAAAKAATEDLNSTTQSLLQTLESVNGAYTGMYKQQIVNKLATDVKGAGGLNLLTAGKTAGVQTADVTAAAFGDPAKIEKFRNALYSAYTTGKLTFDQYNALDGEFARVAEAAGVAEGKYEDVNTALGKQAVSANVASNSYKTLASEIGHTGGALGVYVSTSHDLVSNTAFGQRNLVVLQEHAAAIGDIARKSLAAKVPIAQVASAVETQVGALTKNSTALGFNAQGVQNLLNKYVKLPKSVITELIKRGVLPADIQQIIDRYNHLPKSKRTAVDAQDKASSKIAALQLKIAKLRGKTVPVGAATARAAAQIADLQRQINNLQDKTIYISAVTTTSTGFSTKGSAGATTKGRASGGALPQGWASVGEQGAELAYTAGGRTQIYSNPMSKLILARTGMKAPGFASGTTTVNAEIAASLRPPPTTPANFSTTLSPQIVAAVRDATQAAAALAVYKKLEAQLKALEAAHAASTKKMNAADRQREAALKALASKAKDAYDQISQKAKDSAQKAAESARSLVDSIQSEMDTLKSSVTDFASTMSTALAGDYSLATLWGNAGTALDSAASALQQAQDAIAQATPDTGALTSAQNAQTAATNQLTAAHSALAAAEAAVSAGHGTPAQYATLTNAQKAQTDAVTQLSAANSALTSAEQSVANTAGPTAAQLQALTDAQNAYNAAVAANSVSGLQDSLNQILTSTKTFSTDINALVKAGAGQDLIAQLVGMGATAGDALAKQLLAAGPGAIKSLQTTMTSIANAAGTEGDLLAKEFYGKGANALDQLVAGIRKRFPALKAALAPIVAQIAAMFTFTPVVVNTATTTHALQQAHTVGWLAANYHETVAQLLAANPGLKGDKAGTTVAKGTKLTVPAFATGVDNFAGGLAMVHRGEALVNFTRPGSTVIPANKVKNIFDDSRMVEEIRSLSDRLDGLAERIANASDERGARLFAHAGRENASQVRRAYRKGVIS